MTPGGVAKSWACSLRDVAWAQEGMGSSRLDYLLNQFGFFHEAHRAEADCMALLEVLQRPLPRSGQMGLSLLLQSHRTPEYRVWATGSPFDNKDQLKARGYKFDGGSKVWNLLVAEAQLEQELLVLKEIGFNGKAAKIQIETLDGLVKYSTRSGKKEARAL